MQDVEIEIQVRVEGAAALLQFLKAKAEFTGENYQKDEYYSPAHRQFTAVRPIAEWLRLRESNKHSVTYKKWHYDEEGRSTHCDEYETVVDSIEQLRKIFAAIDIAPVITIEKKRQTWRYQDYEVALDHITELGDFVEVEYKGDTTKVDPKQVTKEMIAFLKQAGCTKVERNYVGYPFMLLYPDEVKFELV